MDNPNVPVSQGDGILQRLALLGLRNHVAANLLLVFVCVLRLRYFDIEETFPTFDLGYDPKLVLPCWCGP